MTNNVLVCFFGSQCRWYMCLQLKEIIADAFSVPFELLCLIHGGKILREPGTVQQHGIKDGDMVHMLAKNPRPVCILYNLVD